MRPEEAFESLELKFTSGNEVPVTRATILIEEWLAIKAWNTRIDMCDKHRCSLVCPVCEQNKGRL